MSRLTPIGHYLAAQDAMADGLSEIARQEGEFPGMDAADRMEILEPFMRVVGAHTQLAVAGMSLNSAVNQGVRDLGTTEEIAEFTHIARNGGDRA